MKIVRYENHHDRLIYGRLEDGLVYPLDGSPFQEVLRVNSALQPLKYGTVDVVAPCEPTKIVALAINYKGATGQSSTMTEPLVFIKGSNSISGPGKKVRLPFVSNTWGEAELGVVIKRRASEIQLQDAARYILGYIPANDVSCDNVDNRDHHLARSKSADGFCPVGHYIDTAYDPENKNILAYQNNILLRSGNTRELIWDVHKTITWLSGWMTLYPGDLVLTGTPPRVRERMFLKSGDAYTVQIEGFPALITEFYA